MPLAVQQLRLQSRRVRRWINGIVASLALLAAIGAPAIYFLIQEAGLQQRLEIHASWTAEVLSHAISRAPELWQFQLDRLEGAVDQVVTPFPGLHRRVLDVEGRVVISSGSPPQWPVAVAVAVLHDGIHEVGQIEDSASLSPVLAHTALFALIGGAVAFVLFIVLRYQALHILDRAVAALESSQDTLRTRLIELEAHKVTLEQQRHELAEAMTQASEARNHAELANRAKSTFLATMSHELRTPLNAILGFSEIIQAEMLGPISMPKYIEYAQDIHDSGQHLLALINDVLDLSKIEAGKMSIDPGPLEVRFLMKNVMRLFKTASERNGLTIVADPDPDVPPLWVDERAAKQILFNLVSNAVKFTARGGRITLTARSVGEGTVELAVADTGVGIPSSEIARIMRPFEQVDNGYERSATGTGLGLSLVAGLAALHGGSVQVDSTVGVGTIVTVKLPAAPHVIAALEKVSLATVEAG